MGNRVVVLGVGVTKFEREPAKKMDEMSREAALMALREAGIGYKEIQAGFISNVYQAGMAPLVYYSIAKTGIPITRLDIACASFTRSAEFGAYFIESGAYDAVMVIGVERMPKGLVPMPVSADTMSITNETLYNGMMGLVTMPGSYAHKAVRYMHLHGAKPEHFAQVSVKNHKNACLNPNAMYQKETSLEEVLNSRMVSYPLTLYQCCANSSGASAVILCSEEKARQYTTEPVFLTGWAEASLKYDPEDPVGSTQAEGDTAGAGRKAYEKAGVGPGDVDLAQVHDAFTTGEIVLLEELGLCPEGQAAFMTWEGQTEIGGKLPVNTDGGLLGCGHPLGATGGRMMAETYWQLKGKAGKRQVEKAKVGLIQNSGLGGTNVLILQT